MHSQMMSPAANPLDMILGLGGASSTAASNGSEDFSRLLNLLPRTVMAMSAPVEGAVAGEVTPLPPEADPILNTMLLIPERLAEMIGRQTGTPAETITKTLPSGEAEPQTLVPAELLVADDGSEETLFLRFRPGLAGDIPVEGSRLEKSGQEMILPMRLRTVEQSGNRLVADAELLGAAGKDISIRLRLELAGKIDGNQQINRITTEDTPILSEHASAGKPGSVARMLGDLGVKLIAIENVENGPAPTLQSVLPEAAPVIKKAAGTKISGQTELRTTAAEATSLGKEVEGLKIGSTTTVDEFLDKVVHEQSDRKAAFSPRSEENSPFVDKLATLAGNSVSSETGPDIAVNAVADGTSSSAEARSEATPVRFYDLDHKLDQLKRNPGQKIRVQLSPARLGKMELSIVSHRGVVTVNLALESTQARQAVERSLPQLESRLAASGIRVDNVQIIVNQPSKGETFAGNYFQQHDGEFAGQQHQGGHRRWMNGQNQLGQFAQSGTGFDQVLVNCLA